MASLVSWQLLFHKRLSKSRLKENGINVSYVWVAGQGGGSAYALLPT